jgi:uncharacterized protein YjbI with pentapeptide repeats
MVDPGQPVGQAERMAIEEHLAILRQGVEAWNAWRERNPGIVPDLSRASLSFETLIGEVNLAGANLTHALLVRARLGSANLAGADLAEANLMGAQLVGANLSGSNLCHANLLQANLRTCCLTGANLRGANLMLTQLVRTDLTKADLTGCRVYGMAAWDLKLEGATQANLLITNVDQPEITVDSLEMAQFIHLLLHNERLRHVIDTITAKAVLILGRFTPPERKAVLAALREELRRRDYLPILFDFEKPASQTTDETVSLLARMARFVVADLTDAKSVLQELRGNVPELPSVPVQPLILASQEEPGMFDFFRRYPWVLETHRYASPNQLMADLAERVIAPAEAKVQELRAPLSPAR